MLYNSYCTPISETPNSIPIHDLHVFRDPKGSYSASIRKISVAYPFGCDSKTYRTGVTMRRRSSCFHFEHEPLTWRSSWQTLRRPYDRVFTPVYHIASLNIIIRGAISKLCTIDYTCPKQRVDLTERTTKSGGSYRRVYYATRAANLRRCGTFKYAGTYVSSPETSRGKGNSYGPTSSVSGGRSRWSLRSLALTREATTRRISGEMGVCSDRREIRIVRVE